MGIVRRLLEAKRYPAVMSADQMADYIESMHHTPEDFETGNILERIYMYRKYHLIRLDPKELREGQWSTDENRVDLYAREPTEIPPIVIDEDGIIIDGTHRHAAAIKLGLPSILVYEGRSEDHVPIEENPYADPGDDDWHPDPDEYGFNPEKY